MKPALDQDGKAIQRKAQYLATYTGRGEFYSGVRTNDPVHVTFGEWSKGGELWCAIRGVGERAGASLSIYPDQQTGRWPLTAMTELTDQDGEVQELVMSVDVLAIEVAGGLEQLMNDIDFADTDKETLAKALRILDSINQ